MNAAAPTSTRSDPASPDPSLSRLPSLTGMRFIAAFLVFVGHISLETMFRNRAANSWFFEYFNRAGWMGVEFFFILSGFVLTWSLRPGDTAPLFWRRRIAKIYPNHVVTWFVGLVLMVVVGQAVTAWNTVPSLLLVHSWIPRVDAVVGTNGPNWSLACEVLFYLCFPVLIKAINRIRERWLWWWAGGVTLAIVIVPVLATLLLPDRPYFGASTISFWQSYVVYHLPPVRMLEFVLGILLARIVRAGQWPRLGFAIPTVLTVIAFVGMARVPATYAMTAVAVLPLALLIPTAASADLRGTWSPVRSRPMIWLGEISFAFYLVHHLVVQFGHDAIGPGSKWSIGAVIGISAAFFAVALLLSWLLYTAVERPVMRRWSRPRRPPAPRTGGPTAAPAHYPARPAPDPPPHQCRPHWSAAQRDAARS